MQLSEAVRELRLAGPRATFPEASRDELVKRFIAEIHGISIEPVM